jgi:hypothetical protein
MSVMNLTSKFDADGVNAPALEAVTVSVTALVAEPLGTDPGPAELTAEGAVGADDCPEHAESIIATPTIYNS